MTESDFLWGTQKNDDRIEDRDLEMTVDGEKRYMNAADYLAAVNASGQAKMAAEDARAAKKAKAKKTSNNKTMLLYLAAGGAALLLLTR